MKKILILTLLLSLSLFISPVFAQGGVQLLIGRGEQPLFAGETKFVDVTVVNNQDFSDTISISIWPPQWGDVRTGIETDVISLDPKENTTTRIYFTTPDCAAESSTQFEISAKSSSGDVSDTKNLIVSVLRKYTICLSDFKLDKYGEVSPTDSMTITSTVINPTSKISPQFSLQTNILYQGQIIKRFDDDIAAIAQRTSKEIINVYNFDKYAAPGDYVIEVLLKDSSGEVKNRMDETIRMKIMNKTTMDKSTQIGFLSAVTTVIVKNEGNIPAPVSVSTSIPSFAKNLFFPISSMAVKTESPGWTEYDWSFAEVQPGESVTVQYEIKLLYVWIFSLLVLVVLGVAFKFVYGPAIVKRYRLVGPIAMDKDITIALEAKNRSRSEMKDVEIRDFVPSLFSVSDRFDTIKPRIMKKTSGGMVLAWKLESLKPFEDRVITYRVRPIMEINGTLRLPKATIRYLNNKRERKDIISKSLIIKAQ